MALRANKTKIVATIGPACESLAAMERMIGAGMNVARLNFSHGDFAGHKKNIENLRRAAVNVGERVAIMADLPGPKMRIGKLAVEPIELKPDDTFTLTTEDIVGDERRVAVTFKRLPEAVTPGNMLYLNDGLIEIEVLKVAGREVHCRVVVGGELRSSKGLNLPGIDLGIGAFTDRDRECLKFALEHGVDAVSQSFVETADDIFAVREAADELGGRPFVIAKIERSGALDHLDEILQAADGIMIARGDLGVEIPIEGMAAAQKHIMHQANLAGKPVITATQMLESMTTNKRPTRAEATDVANAILDGTDCVMLSGESAMGAYPVEAVAMLAKIATAIEPHRPGYRAREALTVAGSEGEASAADLVALSVENMLGRMSAAAVLVPTYTGATARKVTRFRLRVWIAAITPQEAICQQLQFSYGVCPVHEPDYPNNWRSYARRWLQQQGVAGKLVLLTETASARRPEVNSRIEIIELSGDDQ